MAHTLEVKATNGSLVTASTAGTESTANTMSADSTATRAITSGVSSRRPAFLTVKALPLYLTSTGNRRRATRTSGLRSGSTCTPCARIRRCLLYTSPSPRDGLLSIRRQRQMCIREQGIALVLDIHGEQAPRHAHQRIALRVDLHAVCTDQAVGGEDEQGAEQIDDLSLIHI